MNFKDLKEEIPEIFEKVKMDVKRVLKKHRSGLTLGLVKMGMYKGGFIGGLHVSPGTDIYMNETALKILLQKQPQHIVRAYTYHILLHEYIHSLGVLDENDCRDVTLKVSKQLFKKGDPALILAEKGIGAFFPDLNFIYAPPELNPRGLTVDYIKDFDKESLSYFS
ncbi:MAG: hypothetical protein JW891_14090 [Candidatus Lokiarchaeota archaeon]|nr:hypothetical protein [Candidatus Lokiarchaeota archaeon]